MPIVSLFCEIDDFFLAYEKYVAEHCLPPLRHLKAAGVLEVYIPVK